MIKFFNDSNYDFMKISKITSYASLILILLSFIFIYIKGFNFGIDFSGGSLIEARFDNNTSISKLRSVLLQKSSKVQIQKINNSDPAKKDYLIRFPSNNLEQSKFVQEIQDILNENFSNINYRKIDYVGPQIGKELINKGILALILSFLFIFIYVWIRFDWQFSIGAIIALIHDATLIFGFYAVTQIEFNTTSIAAILTVIGYSVNDTVVIFDRIRENIHRYKKMAINQVINISVNSTLSRTIITSGLTLLSLIALILFGGKILLSFSLATFFGIIIGTYSSIYSSSIILSKFDPRIYNKDYK
jgi:preprotein translocase subunit SecF